MTVKVHVKAYSACPDQDFLSPGGHSNTFQFLKVKSKSIRDVEILTGFRFSTPKYIYLHMPHETLACIICERERKVVVAIVIINSKSLQCVK